MAPSPSPAEDAAEAPPRRPGRPRDAQRDRDILEAALEVLCREGLSGLTVDAVAAAAGASKATIYRRWTSKEAMVLDAWRELSPHPVEVPDTGSLRGDLVAMYGVFADKVSTPPLMRVLPHMAAVAQVDEQFGQEYRAYLAERRKPLRAVLERAVARGELPEGTDFDFVQELLAGPIYFRAVVNGRSVSLCHVERFVDVVLAGLTAPRL